MQQEHSKRERPQPPTGGGSPIISTSGRIVNPANPSKPASITLTLTIHPKAESTGRAIVERTGAACDADDFEVVSALLVLFPDVVPRVAEFHGLMDELVRKGDEETIRRICRVPGLRGRPHGDPLYFVAAVEHVMAEQKLERVTDALEWLVDAFAKARARGEDGLPWLPSRKTLQNAHSRLAELFRLWSGSRFVPAELLTARPWMPPGYRPEPPRLIATRLSNAVVLHAPEDRVSEPKK